VGKKAYGWGEDVEGWTSVRGGNGKVHGWAGGVVGVGARGGL